MVREIFKVDGLSTDITAPLSRIENRRRLSDQLRIANAQLSAAHQRLDDDINRHRERAFSLLHHNAGEILDLRRESASLREAYGHIVRGPEPADGSTNDRSGRFTRHSELGRRNKDLRDEYLLGYARRQLQ